MRDILLTLIVFGFIPFIFIRPYVGILVWTWLAYMNPQGMTWGFATEMPYSKIIGIATIIAFIFYKDKILPRSSVLLWLFVFYIVWTTVSTMFAIYPDEAWVQWGDYMKVVLMAFLTLIMTNNKERLHALLAVVVFSIGFMAVKGGIFTIITGGAYRLWGPTMSFIHDNNALGLALVMALPLMWYMLGYFNNKWLKRAMYTIIVLNAFAILGTQSRGAFLAVIAMTIFLVLKSNAKIKTGLVVLMLAPILFTFMPERWHERMQSIKNYQQDESAMMRINAWEYAINLANDYPITGGGYDASSEELFSIYSNRPEIPVTGPHSIYFEVLGQHGWVGLAIFLLLGLVLYRNMSYIIKHAVKYEDMRWARDLAAMTQVSIVGYAVAGAFLELAKYDFYVMLITIAILMNSMLKNRMKEDVLSGSVAEKQPSMHRNRYSTGLKGAPS